MLKIYSFMDLSLITSKPLIFNRILFLSYLFGCTSWHVEKAMASHSSTLAWKIPWTGEPGGLPSMGLHRVGHD